MNNRKTTTTVVTRKRTNNTPKRRQRRAGKQPAGVNKTPAIHIAPCTRMYAKALVNPFSVQGLPCIPDNIVLPSYKFATKARGVFSTGTLGVGFIIIDPFQMLTSNGNIAGIAPVQTGGAIYYTDKTYAQANVQPITVAALTAGVNIANSDSLFVNADFDNTVAVNRRRQMRLVGCGLRIKYIGSNLYNAGRLIIFRNQGNDSVPLFVATTPQTFLQDQYTSLTTVSRGDKYVYYVPDDADFIDYNPFNVYSPNLADPAGVGGIGLGHHSMGIIIDGGSVAPNQQSWEYEAVAYFEAVGNGFTLSRSEGDPVGHDIIMSSLPNAAPTSSPQQVENSVMGQFIKGFTDTTREVAYTVGRKALGYAANAAMNYYNPSARQLYLMPS